jgi:hypothetical protein
MFYKLWLWEIGKSENQAHGTRAEILAPINKACGEPRLGIETTLVGKSEANKHFGIVTLAF